MTMAYFCEAPTGSLVIEDNWPSLWGRVDLLRLDGLHPTGKPLFSTGNIDGVNGKESL